MHRSIVVVALASCYGETVGLAPLHDLTPAPLPAANGAHQVAVTRTWLFELTQDLERRIPMLWVELSLTNADPAPWQLAASSVVIEREGGVIAAEGFVDGPPPHQGDLESSSTVAPGSTRHVWAVFHDVELARPVPLAIRAGGLASIPLVDPARRDPQWVTDLPSNVVVVGMALGGTAFGKDHGAMTYELSASFARRWHELDVGVLAIARMGLEVAPLVEGGAYGTAGGGPQLGYTFRLGSMLLRPSAAWTVSRVGHPMDVVTTRHELDLQLEYGIRRTSHYPLHVRDTAFTWSTFLRFGKTLGSLSAIDEPDSFSFAFGVAFRGGG